MALAFQIGEERIWIEMNIYLAAGFTVMNEDGREREIYKIVEKLGVTYNRLISFYFFTTGDNIMQIIDLKGEIET